MKIKIQKDSFCGKSKEEVMGTYGLTKAQYKYIHGQGVPKDANGKPLEEWEVDLPDNLGENANPQMNQQNTSICTNPHAGSPNCQPIQQWAPQSGFNQYGFPQINNPFCGSNPMFMQQQYQSFAQQYMNEANNCFIFAQRRRMEQCSMEEFYYYLNICNDLQQKAEYYMSLAMANPPQWNQMNTTIVSNSPFGQTNTSISAVNSRYSNMFMGMEIANHGANTAGNWADSIVKLTDAVEHIVMMFKRLR